MPSALYPSPLPLLAHWETYAAACTANGHAPALGPFGTWLVQRVAAAAPPAPAGPLGRARAEGLAAVQAWRFARALGARFRAPGPAAGVGSVDAFLQLYAACKSPAPGLDKTALCRYAGLGATTGGQVLARLVGRGWLVEVRDPADGRRTHLRATPAGQATFQAAAAVFEAGATAALRPLADAELQRFAEALGTVMQSLDAPPGR